MTNKALAEAAHPGTACPSCASTKLVRGSLIASDENETFNGRFYPAGLKFLAFRRSVPVSDQQGFFACTACGCLWNRLDATKLRELLKQQRPGDSPFAPGLSHRGKWALLIALALLVLCGSAGLVSLFGS